MSRVRAHSPKVILATFIEEGAEPNIYGLEGGSEVHLGPIMEAHGRHYRDAVLKRPGVRYELRMELYGTEWRKSAFVQRFSRPGDDLDLPRALDPENLPRVHVSAVPGQANSQNFDEGTGIAFESRTDFERHYRENGLVQMTKADAEHVRREQAAAATARKQESAGRLARAKDILRGRPGGGEALARIERNHNVPSVTSVRPFDAGPVGERLPPMELTQRR